MNATTINPATADSLTDASQPQKQLSHADRATLFIADYGLLILLLCIASATAFAGTGDGAEFDDIYAKIRGWLEGTLGKVMAVSAFGVGMGVGIVKQSLMALAIGIGFAAVLAYAPKIIDTIFSFAI
ncbi:TraA family conjugative transfer protein [Rhodanobacter denitrificans]|uniref:TraA family conjugative transfer protein n=1 Tax=Rhodanobacter denitrificans TaxID=666685 RepID=UPI001F23D19E|nr:TraA family conjugative transfer protein [Rhodanobacter denitrificans]UJJ60575.1 hypothetical protein LRK55_19265 [Rhodanobacter denitrificans]